MRRVCFLVSMVCLLALAGCDGGSGSHSDGTPDDARAMRWWNALNAEQMVAALYGDEATTEQTVAAQKMYADLDDDTKALANMTADEIYGDGGFDSAGAWWESLDCRLMRIAAGDGKRGGPDESVLRATIRVQELQRFCLRRPRHTWTRSAWLCWTSMSRAFSRRDKRTAMRWWNVLNAEQMAAALYGDEATAEQTTAAQRMYADLDDDTKALVNVTADELYGMGDFDSIGEWWETLDCHLMRVAPGDGNVADPESPYCAHYPGSGAAKILSDEAKAHVDYVGMAPAGPRRSGPVRTVRRHGNTRHRHHPGIRHGKRGWHHRA